MADKAKHDKTQVRSATLKVNGILNAAFEGKTLIFKAPMSGFLSNLKVPRKAIAQPKAKPRNDQK